MWSPPSGHRWRVSTRQTSRRRRSTGSGRTARRARTAAELTPWIIFLALTRTSRRRRQHDPAPDRCDGDRKFAATLRPLSERVSALEVRSAWRLRRTRCTAPSSGGELEHNARNGEETWTRHRVHGVKDGEALIPLAVIQAVVAEADGAGKRARR